MCVCVHISACMCVYKHSGACRHADLSPLNVYLSIYYAAFHRARVKNLKSEPTNSLFVFFSGRTSDTQHFLQRCLHPSVIPPSLFTQRCERCEPARQEITSSKGPRGNRQRDKSRERKKGERVNVELRPTEGGGGAACSCSISVQAPNIDLEASLRINKLNY